MMSAGPQRQHTSQEVADVLQLVVQHCPDASDVVTLCRLLEVNRPVQAAVRTALGHCSLAMPSIVGDGGDFTTARLAAACSWLPRNIGLVRHLSAGEPVGGDPEDYPTNSLALCHETASHLVTLALQLCATQAQAAAITAAAAAAAAAPAPQHEQHHPAAAAAATAAVPWQLRSANIHWLASAPMLAALAACTSLTSLQLDLRTGTSSDAPLFRALGSMQHLETLKLCVAEEGRLTHTTWLQQLTRLRKLELLNDLSPDGCAHLPASLQHLTAMAGLDAEQDSPAVICMSQLVQLQDLQLCVRGVLGSGSILPPHITYLQVMGEEAGVLPALQGLQQLQELYVQAGDECLPFLQQLSRLRSLRAVDIGVDCCDLRDDILPGQPGQLERLLGGVAAAPQITKLVLADRSSGQDSGDPHPSPRSLFGVQLTPHLRRLTALRHLDIASLDVQPEDAVHFTALKSLTALHLYNAWNLGDVAAAAIAVSLSGNLRVLELIDCGLESPVLWPAVGTCTSLESLCIDSAPNNLLRLEASTLHLLTNLSRLTALTGPEVWGLTAREFDAFCAEKLPALVVKPKWFL